MEVRVEKREEGFTMLKGGKGYTIADIEALPEGERAELIEIVSPSSKIMDYERKVKLYREAGVREYWIVDPETETVTRYDFEHGKESVQYSFSERIKVGIFEELWLNLLEMDIG